MIEMIRLDQMREARRAIERAWRDIQEQLKIVQERCEMVKGNVVHRQRRCGKKNCRCWGGGFHEGGALSVRQGDRWVGMSLNDVSGERTKRLVGNYQRFRRARREMIHRWQRLLKATDELGELREVEAQR